MPNISTLTVRLSANSAKLVSEFSKAQRRAKTFADKMKSTLATVGRTFARLGAVAATGLLALSLAGIKAGDSLAKTASKLGIAAGELAGLRFAAEQTGVPLRTLDMGLQRMVRRVSEAARGTGEAQAAIRELGLDAKELNRQTPDEIFRQIADAMESVGSQSDRVRLSFKIFDSEGVGLANTLAAGREQLVKYADEARKLGLTLGAKQLVNIQAAADAQNRVGKAFAGLGRQLGATLAPAITKISNATANFVSLITQSLPAWAAWAASILGVVRNLNMLSDVELQATIRQIRKDVGELIDARDALAKPFQQAIGQGDILPVGVQYQLDDYNKRIAVLTARAAEAQAALSKVGESTKTLTSAISAGISVSAANRAEYEKVRQTWADADAALTSYIANQNRLAGIGKSIYDSTRTGAEQYIAKMKEAREAFAGGFIDQETFERNRAMLLDGLVPAIDTVKKKTNDLGLTFSSAFEDAIVEGAKLRDVLKSIYQDMLRIIARRAVTEPLGDAFSGFLSKIIPGLATGGPVTAGQPYIVGDGGGPELFIPKQSGQVVAHGKYGGGGSFNFNYAIDARGADEARIMRILPAIMQQTEQRTLATLARLRTEGQV